MRRLLLGLVVGLWGCAGWAQQYTAKKVVFSEMGTYSQQDLEDLAGVHAGTTLTADELGAAAQRLSDSGFFDQVSATLNGPVKAVAVLFTVKPIDTNLLVPASFANFVWFTPEEVAAAVHAQLPLFRGAMPAVAEDKAAAALEQALATKGVTGAAVVHANLEPRFGHAQRYVQFSVVKRPVVLRGAALGGVSVAMQAAVQKQAALLAGKPYREGVAGETTVGALLAPYLDAGYLDARLAGLERTVTETPERTLVTVKGTVDEGAIWRVSGLTYGGSEYLGAAEFAKEAKLRAEDVASRTMLRQTLAPIDAAYRNHGYMDAVADVMATRDEASHHVAYAVTVMPGEVYRFKTVTPTNMPDVAKAAFESGFPMKDGDVYQPAVLTAFLQKLVALDALKKWNAGFRAESDPETHTVAVTVNFAYAWSVK